MILFMIYIFYLPDVTEIPKTEYKITPITVSLPKESPNTVISYVPSKKYIPSDKSLGASQELRSPSKSL